MLHLATSAIGKEAQCLLGLFGFWRQHIAHLGVLLQLIYKVTRKMTGFEWVLEKEKALQQVLTAVQTALPFGSYALAD
jgi:hypothetical protein